MRMVTLFTAGFFLAVTAFVATMLVSPPTSVASGVSFPPTTDPITICEFLPTGDVARCTIQN